MPTIDDLSDPVFEDDETFTVTISDPTNATILDGVAKGTIVDDEPVPTASMFRSSLNMREGEGQVRDVVLIDLSPKADRTLEVELVVSGTAEPGVDYAALAPTVTIHSGVSRVGVPVTIYEDDVYETVETIGIAMVAVGSDIRVDTNAGSMQIEIVDNDPAPLLSVQGGTGTEGGQNHGTSPVAGQDFANVVFELELSGQMGNAFTVQYETVDGTARAGADYEPVAGTATIPAGQTSAFVLVPVVDDDEFEGANAETVSLRVFDASHPIVLQGSTPGRGFVADDEEIPAGADYVGQTVDTEGSVAVGESWYHGSAIMGRIEYRINARRDVDWYQVTLPRGSCYEIDVRGATTWQRYLDGDFPVAVRADRSAHAGPSVHPGPLRRRRGLRRGHPGQGLSRLSRVDGHAAAPPRRHLLHRGDQPDPVRVGHVRPVGHRLGQRNPHLHQHRLRTHPRPRADGLRR